MNFHFPFFTKPTPQPLRAVVATRVESLAAQRRRTDKILELAVYKATTTPEQRKAEADAWFAIHTSPKAREAIRRAARGRAA